MFDQRLLNQSQGLSSGFADDDVNAVYSEPWRAGADIAQHIYRPSKNIEKEYGDELENLARTSR